MNAGANSPTAQGPTALFRSAAAGLLAFTLLVSTLAPAGEAALKLAEPLTFHDEFVEVTSQGTLRRRYRVRDDYNAEVAAWAKVAQERQRTDKTEPRVFRLGCVFL